MLLKKLFFLALPIILVYWRSRTAQNAARWLFRGVVPTEGPLGQVFSELSRDQRQSSQPVQGAASATPRPASKPRLAAQIANNWPIVLAFLAGICVAGWIFSIASPRK